LRHLSRCFGVDRIGVVLEGRLEKAAQVNDGPDNHDQEKEEISS
jgi:hypothetical protein